MAILVAPRRDGQLAEVVLGHPHATHDGKRMNILIAHNRYQEQGGEDRVVAEEAAMLERHGHRVELFLVDNDAIREPFAMVGAAFRSFYSTRSAAQISALMDRFAPDILHVHNFLPNLSPSVFFAAKRKHVPTVETLHNYRMICANALLFRDGHVCEECVEAKSFLPGVRHGCYRGSRLGSAVVGGSMALHAALGTWNSRVDRYIALTEFAARKLSQRRAPAERIRIKPNFVQDPGIGSGDGDFVLYAGRLSPEKGVQVLLDADALANLPLRIKIAGDGPMMPALRAAANLPGSQLDILGAIQRDELQRLMGEARAVVVPSLWYESCPMVIVEALASGTPVICSDLGSLPDLVEHGVSGFTFATGDATALCGALDPFSDATFDREGMRVAARSRYESEFSETRNHEALMNIYREAVATARSAGAAS